MKKGNRTVVWLDLASSFGSIPHDLIRTVLKFEHPRPHQGNDGLRLRFKTRDYITLWQHLEERSVTACTTSPILFIMGMNLIITAAEKENRGPTMDTGDRHHISRATTHTGKVWGRPTSKNGEKPIQKRGEERSRQK